MFRTLYRARFPIRRCSRSTSYHGSDARSTAADNTSGFNCRAAVAPGPKPWSMHAYGEAIDVNDVENPYIESARVIPPAGKAYPDRANVRPGMAVEGGVLVRAFASVGWGWGGRFAGRPTTSTSRRTGASAHVLLRRGHPVTQASPLRHGLVDAYVRRKALLSYATHEIAKLREA